MLNNGNGLIILPSNPFWDVFKRFGRDEMIALVINFSATLALSLYFASAMGETTAANLLVAGIEINLLFALVGPIVEKIGFFPAHFKEAFDIYRITPIENRYPLSYYTKKALRGGTKSLIQDILIHDPIYIGIMYVGLLKFPGTPAWILAVFSFVVAVFIVAGLEVGFVEFLYRRCKMKLQKMGFGITSYLESRFHFESYETARDVFDILVEKYDLGTIDTSNIAHPGESSLIAYHDRYVGNSIPIYNARKVRVRFRQRKFRDDRGLSQSAQIAFTRVNEMARKEISQFRYYPVRKDKLYFQFPNKMCWKVNDIVNTNVRSFLQKFHNEDEAYEIEFVRCVANNPDTILVSIDRMEDVTVVEIKAYSDKKRLLKEAMQIAMHAGGTQTTHGKRRIVRMSAV